MKHLIIALLLSLCTQTYASVCNNLRISINNDTPSTCYLIQKSVRSGAIIKRQPYKIKSGVSIIQFEATEVDHSPISILLTYECGENHSVTFLSEKQPCSITNSGKIQGSVIKSNNLTATYSTTESSFYASKPNTILWTIS